MALKYVKKKKLEFKDGYFMLDGKIVTIDHCVVVQLNDIETVWQQYNYIIDQPRYVKAPSLKGFERESIDKHARVTVQTPTLDAEYERAVKIMAEIDAKGNVERVNELYARYDEVLQWVKSKRVMVNTSPTVEPLKVDTPKLGNPLDLEPGELESIIFTVETDHREYEEDE